MLFWPTAAHSQWQNYPFWNILVHKLISQFPRQAKPRLQAQAGPSEKGTGIKSEIKRGWGQSAINLLNCCREKKKRKEKIKEKTWQYHQTKGKKIHSVLLLKCLMKPGLLKMKGEKAITLLWSHERTKFALKNKRWGWNWITLLREIVQGAPKYLKQSCKRALIAHRENKFVQSRWERKMISIQSQFSPPHK